MSELNFHCEFHSSEMNAMELPVEIRKPNLALVAKTLTSQSVTLQPGDYIVTARLPSGQELYDQVTVGNEATVTANLVLDPEDRSPHEDQELQRFMINAEVYSFSPSAGGMFGLAAPKELRAKLRKFQGNILKAEVTEVPVVPPAGQVSITRPARGAVNVPVYAPPCTTVQLVTAGTVPVNILVPPAPSGAATVLQFTRQPDDNISFDMRLDNPAADSMLRYYERGLINQADSIITADSNVTGDARRLLFEKISDPIGACLGAYVLLRLGDIRRLNETLTENLMNFFDWLPDGLVIRAEHLARLGNHSAAYNILLKLESRGMPFFSDGLSYAVNRLRTYIHLDPADSPFAGNPEAEILFRKLRQFVTYVDFHKSITTFTGLDPANPGSAAVEKDLKYDTGFDLSPYFN